MKLLIIGLLTGLILIFLFPGCVPPQIYSETEKESNLCKNERDELLTENEKLVVKNTELASQLELAGEAVKRAEENGFENVDELKNLKSRYNLMTEQYNQLDAAHQALINGSDSETRQLMKQLETTQKDLYQREDQLNNTKARLDKDREELDQIKRELEQKSARLLELQKIIDQKDAQADVLKQKLSSALIGYENQGLTITKKNGKIYVSLDEKLLFPSGSTEVDPRGRTALRKLAGVLEQNRDINIQIEGHTDDVPVIPGSRFNDNWDLSTARSTAIIRILLEGSTIDPKRLTASGRGEYFPVDPRTTADARQKNRRTEIILEPNLDEVFNLLEK
jgi:chemotaxis protein MotB